MTNVVAVDAGADLRDLVTVFVSTVGYPTFDTCLDHLRRQDCTFTLKIVDHVAPMSAAFQQMMDQCTTPSYVQVDEDMLLYPHAIRTLHDRLSSMDARVAQYVAALYDVHLERVIYGIKIFRHEIVRHYPFRDVTGCEWDQVRRFRADRYVDIRVTLDGASRSSEDTLGLHGTRWTPDAVYLRFATLERKRRMGNRTHEWLPDAAVMILRRFLETRSEVDFFALMGVLSGSLCESQAIGRERDYREYDKTPGFGSLATFVSEVRMGWADGRVLRSGEYDIDVLRDQGEAGLP